MCADAMQRYPILVPASGFLARFLLRAFRGECPDVVSVGMQGEQFRRHDQGFERPIPVVLRRERSAVGDVIADLAEMGPCLLYTSRCV